MFFTKCPGFHNCCLLSCIPAFCNLTAASHAWKILTLTFQNDTALHKLKYCTQNFYISLYKNAVTPIKYKAETPKLDQVACMCIARPLLTHTFSLRLSLLFHALLFTNQQSLLSQICQHLLLCFIAVVKKGRIPEIIWFGTNYFVSLPNFVLKLYFSFYHTSKTGSRSKLDSLSYF